MWLTQQGYVLWLGDGGWPVTGKEYPPPPPNCDEVRDGSRRIIQRVRGQWRLLRRRGYDPADWPHRWRTSGTPCEAPCELSIWMTHGGGAWYLEQGVLGSDRQNHYDRNRLVVARWRVRREGDVPSGGGLVVEQDEVENWMREEAAGR